MGWRQRSVGVVRALEAGIEFILRSRDGEGAWHDFDLYLGASDEWVTAYTGCSLAGTGHDGARRSAEQAWRWLERRAERERPGFGFNGRASTDADSTTWACRLAGRVGRQGPALAAAGEFLASCRQSDGGIATYPSDAAVRAAIRIENRMPTNGWASSHVCVTSAAAGLPQFHADGRLRDFLLNAQTPSGAWRGYWWCDPEYATALSIEALPGSDAARRGAEYLQTSRNGGSPFVTALRIAGCGHAGIQPSETLRQALLDSQMSDGSWPASARLRIPAPGETDPDTRWNWDGGHKGFGSIRLDINRIFTTATAVRALALAAGA